MRLLFLFTEFAIFGYEYLNIADAYDMERSFRNGN